MKKYNDKKYNYLAGFGNYHQSEALPGSLPHGQNSPQKAPYGLIAEQLSGSAFTMARSENFRTWFYRILPSVLHEPFISLASNPLWNTSVSAGVLTPNQLRWSPLSPTKEKKMFYDSIETFAVNGDPMSRSGSAVHLYQFSEKMTDTYFTNSDGDMLFVPQNGSLEFRTECGPMHVNAGEIAVVPRGFKFQLNPADQCASGYICEIFGSHLRLPDLGPIGSNGLAHPRDFLTPTASFEEKSKSMTLINRFGGALWAAKVASSPLDVVAWHGNYVPYKYDLALFNTINTVSVDHPDPSIFTVLTSPTSTPGMAEVDFVIFPPRWMVAERTFRPPYFHRNVMSEYMGLIHGTYDAKPSGGFEPGGGSLHNCMSAHGPEKSAYENAVAKNLTPENLQNTLAFMFESSKVYKPTAHALEHKTLQKDYWKCWQGLPKSFKQNSQ